MSKADLSMLVGRVWSSLPASTLKKAFQVPGIYDDLLQNQNPINRNAIVTSNPKQADIDAYGAKKEKDNLQQLEPNLDQAATSINNTTQI
ncbi:hypothetical protein JTB14_022273 [Gonioctena quinquepunctata]|nr:hypothetical protein JTB14_022273 [Gonioctena quinquepunctata]